MPNDLLRRYPTLPTKDPDSQDRSNLGGGQRPRKGLGPEPSWGSEAGLQLALKSIQEWLGQFQMQADVLEQKEGFLILGIPFAGETWTAHLSASWSVPGESNRSKDWEAWRGGPIPVHVLLERSAETGLISRVQGLPEFIDALKHDRMRWKRHMLGNTPARIWLERLGHVSELGFHIIEDGWPYLRVDGRPMKLPDVACWRKDDPPIDPWELCRSVIVDDEWELFTCECSVRDCGRIYRGVLVAHEDGLVLWRCPERPEEAMAIFSQRQYRRAVRTVVRHLLRTAPTWSGMNWTMQVTPRNLRRALRFDCGHTSGRLPSSTVFMPNEIP